MKVGLAGYSGSGVTTLLALLSEDPGLLERHAGPEIRTIKLADHRLERLAGVCEPEKVTTVQLELIELGDLRPEAGGGLRQQTVNRAAGLDVLAIVFRGFLGPSASQCRPGDEILKEFLSLSDDLCLTDQLPVEGRIYRLSKEGRSSSPEAVLMEKVKALLEAGAPLRTGVLSDEEIKFLSGYQFLTLFPVLVVGNTGEDGAGVTTYPDLEAACGRAGAHYMEITGLPELELLELPSGERREFQQALEIEVPAKDRFISAAFNILDIITFYTVSGKEARGWAVPAGTTALEAAGRVHSDLARGFIRAETMQWDELCAAGGLSKARETGKIRVEGKDYVIRDGDVIQVRFNI